MYPYNPPSGDNAPFKFRRRTHRIPDLASLLASVDVERIASTGTITDLQDALYKLTFSDLDERDIRTLSVGSNAAQLVRIFQLGVEYLHHVQNVLLTQQKIDQAKIQKLMDEKAALLKENADLKAKNKYLKDKLIEYANRLKQAKKFLCPYCPSTYRSAEHLAEHLNRRHPRAPASGPGIDEDLLVARITGIVNEAAQTINNNSDSNRNYILDTMNRLAKPIQEASEVIHGRVVSAHKDLSDKEDNALTFAKTTRDEEIALLTEILNLLKMGSPAPSSPEPVPVDYERKYAWFPDKEYLLASFPRPPPGYTVNSMINALANVVERMKPEGLERLKQRARQSTHMDPERMQRIVDQIVEEEYPKRRVVQEAIAAKVGLAAAPKQPFAGLSGFEPVYSSTTSGVPAGAIGQGIPPPLPPTRPVGMTTSTSSQTPQSNPL